MSTRKIIEVLRRMDQQIMMRSTGSPQVFASRIGVSERTLYNYLTLLKELGASIRFSSWRDSYEYLEEGRISLEYQDKKNEKYKPMAQ